MAFNLSRSVERHAQFTPYQAAPHWHGQDTDYRGLWQQVNAGTSALLEAGVRHADRLAWLCLNDPRLLVTLCALAAVELPPRCG